jgi:hypothetical protein
MFRGSCICVGGLLCEFCIGYFGGLLFVVSLFCLGCVESFPLPKGAETFLFQVIFLFTFVSAFDRLFEFLLVVSFLFLFSLVTKCVCC